jgi:flagellar operon protein
MNPVNPSNINPSTLSPNQGNLASKTTAGALSFQQVLQGLQQGSGEELKFSAHAQQRIQDRNISLSSQDLSRLQQGVAQAAAKGSKESLLLKDNLAFVVSVKNNTVITAVDAASMKGNVFTNIDSAVIV